MFERFTDRARRVIVLSQEAARALRHNYLGTEHLLLGIIDEEGGIGARVLAELGVTRERVLGEVLESVGEGDSNPDKAIPFTPRAKKTLELALREALQLGHNYIGTEHLLLGLIRDEVGASEGSALRILTSLNINLSEARAMVISTVNDYEPSASGSQPEPEEAVGGGGGRPGRSEHSAKSTLDAFSVNLTEKARQNDLDPVIGREKEVDRVIQVLARRTKNNPVLIGEPGVGKTAIVEGLAQAIINKQVPKLLQNKEILSLDLVGMIAGAKYRGEFEDRLKKSISEIRKRNNVIVFIDELHTIVGAGAAEGAVDAANILKPLLARGDFQTIGATTLDEYRKHVEKDAALERRFQPVIIEAPSVEQTIEILMGLRDRYEIHHRISISDEALTAAAQLSDRYISDRFLPDKAIDLVDEAGARLRLWNSKNLIVDESLDEQIAQARAEKSAAITGAEFEKAASARKREQDLLAEKAQSVRVEAEDEDRKAWPELTSEMIAKVLADATGVPVAHVSESETARLKSMDEELHKRVIGQSDAVRALTKAIRRTRAGLKDPRRPSGSFIFAGPSGVGKTELSKALAQFLFGDDDALITIDMSEFAEKHAVARLFGAPPGYVGYEEGGQLTEKIRRKPFSVVLFDEIEKAHPDVFNSLLQMLDEGRLTDAQGRAVDFKNTVVIMTTNLGSRDISKPVTLGFGSADNSEGHYERMKSAVGDELKRHFRPEFLNRIDDTIVFHHLTKENIMAITDILIADLERRLAGKNLGIALTVAAKEEIAKRGYDPVYGARPLRRVIQRDIEDGLSEQILFGDVSPGQIVQVDFQSEEFVFTGVDKSLPESPSDAELPSNK